MTQQQAGNKPTQWVTSPNCGVKKGAQTEMNGAANSQQMGLQTVRKRDENKGKKKGSKTKLEKRAKLKTKL